MPSEENFLKNPDWEEVVYPCNRLWTGFNKFYRHKPTNVHTFPGLGDPLVIQDLHENFVPRPADINVVTFPKAGTTWIQEVAYLIDTDIDLKTAHSVQLEKRFPFVEVNLPPLAVGRKVLDTLPPAPASRYVKWHNSQPLLPRSIFDTSRVIYMARNPKDLCVSYYHFARMNKHFGFVGNFCEFLECFVNGTVPFGPYWFNVLSYWKIRDNPNVLFLKYEDMQSDILAQIKKISDFLGKNYTLDEMKIIAQNVSFDSMRQNPMVNHEFWDKVGLRKNNETPFFRSGTVGNWRKYFNEAQEEIFDTWIEDNSFGSGLKFEYVI